MEKWLIEQDRLLIERLSVAEGRLVKHALGLPECVDIRSYDLGYAKPINNLEKEMTNSLEKELTNNLGKELINSLEKELTNNFERELTNNLEKELTNNLERELTNSLEK
ncbi:hypothetical protein ACLOJK_027951 [Asimina triloba]